MKENEKKYNTIDFARYHSGEMLPDEMHALEKAALEDPFLSDALEGYRYSKDSVKELGEIRKRLAEKRKRNNIFSLSSGGWWKIAAMFILLVGTGYFFFISNSQKEHSLAIKEPEVKKENPTTISPVKSDTIATEGNIAFENAAADKNNKSTLSIPTTKSSKASSLKKNAKEEMRNIKEKNFAEDYLPDEREKSIALNKVNAAPSNITAKDSGEKSFFRSSDTTALIAAPVMKYLKDSDNAIGINKNEQAQQKIVIRGVAPETKETRSLNEVAVAGYGTQKKKSITRTDSEKLEGKVSGVEISSNLPHPKGDKEKFNQYIKDNAVPILDSAGKAIPANILLSFTLNKRGKPSHIKVIESSCKPCEKEAIRLLKNGPDWIGRHGEAGKVRIKF